MSQELQLTYQTESLTGVVGLYYFEQTSDDIVTVELNPPPPGVQRDSDNNKVDNNSWAAFTQWTYNVTDKLALTAGGRYTEDEKGSFPDQFDFATPTVKQVPVQWYRDTFTSFTPSASDRLSLDGRRDDVRQLRGGLQGRRLEQSLQCAADARAAGGVAEVRARRKRETIEVGAKLDLADNTVRLNVAVFTSDYTDMQVTYRGPAPAAWRRSSRTPARRASTARKLELTWAPTAGLGDRRERRLSRCDDRELDNIAARCLAARAARGQRAAVRARVAGARRHRIRAHMRAAS